MIFFGVFSEFTGEVIENAVFPPKPEKFSACASTYKKEAFGSFAKNEKVSALKRKFVKFNYLAVGRVEVRPY